ncbi:hypothetical protein HBH56_251350 [Parastagonospora nodorum]|nr:hypothetical protein HBH56_251350 [Parastagonospora nodorum]
MCAKDDLVGRKGPLSTSTQTWEVLFQTHDGRLAGEPATAESVTAKEPPMARGNAIRTILFAFIMNYILETGGGTYNKAYQMEQQSCRLLYQSTKHNSHLYQEM